MFQTINPETGLLIGTPWIVDVFLLVLGALFFLYAVIVYRQGIIAQSVFKTGYSPLVRVILLIQVGLGMLVLALGIGAWFF